MRKALLITKAGYKEGLGHLYRTTTLASYIDESLEIITCVITNEELHEDHISENIEYITVESENQALKIAKENITFSNLIVLDTKRFTNSFNEKLFHVSNNLLIIDDLHEKSEYKCKALISTVNGISEKYYPSLSADQLFLGHDYAILRKEFLNISKNQNKINEPEPGTILIAIGGTDPLDLTEKIFELCLSKKIHKINILTSQNKRNAIIEKLKKKGKSLRVHYNLNGQQIIELIKNCEIAIVPGSTFAHECSCVGVKLIIGYFTDDQKDCAAFFGKHGLAINVGDFRKLNYLHPIFARLLGKQVNHIENQRANYYGQQLDKVKSVIEFVINN